MKETRFIAQNKEKWQESESLLREPQKDPEKLSDLFTQVIDDLSYSRTYYPNRSVRVYLNKIAREYFSIIYSQHRHKKNSFSHFWLDELPQIVYQGRRPLLISLFVFILSMGIGVFSSMKDPEFATSILGERYVSMTKANIEKGDPMAVYKEAHQAEMFLGITLNNLMVAFRTYVFGVFFSIGTLAILLSNGIMVGCFQFFFIERGLFAESALTIWLHGTLEISSIILAGGAGLILGSGLLFPGSYSRMQAFQLSAVRSLKLMIGIVPIFVLAAIIESFLTRYTEMPDFLRLLLIVVSALCIIGYFVVYPWRKSRTGFSQPLEETRLPPDKEERVSYTRIKNNGEIIKDSFTFYRQNFSRFFGWVCAVTVMMTVAEFFLDDERAYFLGINPFSEFLDSLYYAVKTPSLAYVAINAACTSLILHRVFAWVDTELNSRPGIAAQLAQWFQTLLVVAFCYWIIFRLEEWGVLLVICFWSLVMLLCFAQHSARVSLPSALRIVWGTATWSAVGLGMVLLLLSFSFLVIVSAPGVYLNFTILQWNFAETDEWSRGVIRFVSIFLRLFAFNLILPVFGSAVAYLYYSLRETHTADHLQKAIEEMPSKYLRKDSFR